MTAASCKEQGLNVKLAKVDATKEKEITEIIVLLNILPYSSIVMVIAMTTKGQGITCGIVHYMMLISTAGELEKTLWSKHGTRMDRQTDGRLFSFM